MTEAGGEPRGADHLHRPLTDPTPPTNEEWS